MHASSTRPDGATPAPAPPAILGGAGDVVARSDGRRIRVRAIAWGIHRSAKTTAHDHLLGRLWPGAHGFDVIGADFLLSGAPCPLDLKHETVLARKATYGWAWILRAADDPHPAATLELGEPGDHAGVAGGRGGL